MCQGVDLMINVEQIALVLDALPDVLGNRLHSVCVTASADQRCLHHHIQARGVVETHDLAQWQWQQQGRGGVQAWA